MAIANTTDYLQKIYNRVCKGSLQFEPQDRIPVYIGCNAEDGKTRYCVGGVSIDQYTGQLTYSLFTAGGAFVPCATGVREMETLSPKEIIDVANKADEYFVRALRRLKNLRSIMDILKENGNEIHFGDNRPEVLVDPDMSGNLRSVKADVVFFVESDRVIMSESCDVFITAKDDSGKEFNTPLLFLTDAGVSNVFSCMPQPKLSRKEEVRERHPLAKTTKAGVKL